MRTQHTSGQSRRQFLRAAAGISAAVAGAGVQRLSAPFALSMAGLAGMAAQSSTKAAEDSGPDYRALVCLFMNGGNDAHNWVVPWDASGYAEYALARGGLALPRSRLDEISSRSSQGAGRSFAMPAELAPLAALYEQGRAAVVANVGTLLRPTTLADYQRGVDVPLKLFSHNDQASTWQSLSPEGARSGWGGRMGDIFAASNDQPLFTAISASGNAVFLSGDTISQYQVSTAGPIAIAGLSDPWLMGSSTAAAALRRTLADAGTNPFQADYSKVVQRSIQAEGVLKGALAGVTVAPIPATPVTVDGGATTLDRDPLAQQLRMVAQLIGAQQRLGARRQVFMVSIGGFDAHANQMRDEAALMGRVVNAVSYFLTATDQLGLAEQVTLFTASDFGRTLASNGDGSDHGWGSHHFVAGGAVKGRDIYGQFPITALGTPNDLGSGRLLPTTAVTQYAAQFGTWMGLSPTELATVLPGLQNFPTQPLGFL